MKNQTDQLITNFKKAEGSIGKIVQMLEEGRYCVDVMQQNLAVIGLLKSAHRMLMERHLNTCFKSASESKDRKKQKDMALEIMKVTQMFTKELQ